MLLAIDAGNTNIVFALFEGEALKQVWRCETHPLKTAKEYADWLKGQGLDFPVVMAVVMGSVVPAADKELKKFCRDAFGVTPLVAGPETVNIKINLKNAAAIGADRLINGYAAILDYGAPAVVVDFGTATTFDVVNGRGEFCGGVIAPGPNLSMEALHRAAAKLPAVKIEKPPAVIGADTVTAMQSGLFWGYVSLVEGLLARIAAEMGERPRIIATGGLSGLFAPAIPAIEKTDKDLTLRGLLYIYKQKAGTNRRR